MQSGNVSLVLPSAGQETHGLTDAGSRTACECQIITPVPSFGATDVKSSAFEVISRRCYIVRQACKEFSERDDWTDRILNGSKDGD